MPTQDLKGPSGSRSTSTGVIESLQNASRLTQSHEVAQTESAVEGFEASGEINYSNAESVHESAAVPASTSGYTIGDEPEQPSATSGAKSASGLSTEDLEVRGSRRQ